MKILQKLLYISDMADEAFAASKEVLPYNVHLTFLSLVAVKFDAFGLNLVKDVSEKIEVIGPDNLKSVTCYSGVVKRLITEKSWTQASGMFIIGIVV